jgi:hypothetical protein
VRVMVVVIGRGKVHCVGVTYGCSVHTPSYTIQFLHVFCETVHYTGKSASYTKKTANYIARPDVSRSERCNSRIFCITHRLYRTNVSRVFVELRGCRFGGLYTIPSVHTCRR